MLLLLLLPWSPVGAHVGDLINGIDVSPGDPVALPPIEASYGLLLPEDDGWRWVCHEAITEPKAVSPPRFTRGADGAWLAWLPDPTQGRDGHTLFRSDDACSWTAPELAVPGTVTAATWTGDGGAIAVTEAPGAILASADGGRSFGAVVVEDPDLAMTSAKAAGGAVWVAGIPTDGRSARVWVDLDGAGLVARDLPLPATVEAPIRTARLFDVHGTSAVLVFDPSGGDTAVRTDDGGQTWTVVHEAAGAILDAALDGDATWVVLDGVRLARIEADGTSSEMPAFPRSIGIGTDGAGGLWVPPQSSLVSALLSRSTDGGATFEILAYPDDIVGPLQCPADSEGARVCAPLWDQLLPRIRGFDDPPVDTAIDTGGPDTGGPADDTAGSPPPPPPPGDRGRCGCGGFGSAGLGGVAGAALAGSRRRRRHR